MGMGFMMPAMFSRYFGDTHQKTPENSAGKGFICQECENPVPEDAKFCPACGHQLLIFDKCVKCGKNITPNAQFCSRCGYPVEKKPESWTCSKCGSENLPESLFCNQCGEKY
jgi:rRNA maturation endonuclease Nob1